MDQNAGFDCPWNFVYIWAIGVGLLKGKHDWTVEGSAGNTDQAGKVSFLTRFYVVVDKHVNCATLDRSDVFIQDLKFVDLVALGLGIGKARADYHGLKGLVD